MFSRALGRHSRRSELPGSFVSGDRFGEIVRNGAEWHGAEWHDAGDTDHVVAPKLDDKISAETRE